MGLSLKINQEKKKKVKNSLSSGVIGVILSGLKKLQFCRLAIVNDNF